MTERRRRDAPGVRSAHLRPPAPRGLLRRRLLDALTTSPARVVLVVAPAGSGKSTLLAHLVARRGEPSLWLRVGEPEAHPRNFLRHLAACCSALDAETADLADLAEPTVDSVLDVLDARAATPLVLAVDDVHLLVGTPGEAELERLLRLAPPDVRFVLAGRRAPEVNLPRLRLEGELLEIGGDDLRFRSWEVERLLREVYGEPLPPEDVAVLTRRTQGWAAGLQLFHLATRGRPAPDRRRQLASLTGRSRLVHEYLARNVLAGLPDELHRFLVRTSPFDVLTADLCDRLLERRGSQRVLEELELGQVFTFSPDDGTSFRYHPVLREHLEGLLVEEFGREAADAWHRRVGGLLEADGRPGCAARVYARIAAWADVARLLAAHGATVADAVHETRLDALAAPDGGGAAGTVTAAGWPLDGAVAGSAPGAGEHGAGLVVRCFGGLAVEVDGVPLALQDLRPRARSLLRLLLLECGRPVHREVLVDRLWTDLPVEAALHNVQVAVSAVRRLLEPERPRGTGRLLARAGDAYVLTLPDGSHLDLAEFDRAVREAAPAPSTTDHAPVVALRRVVDLHTGDLFPEEGPAEWVVEERRRRRLQAADAATRLAGLALARGAVQEAKADAATAVRLDPHGDTGWRLLVQAHEAAGEPAAAQRCRHEHRLVLAGLGVDDPGPPPGDTTATTPLPRHPASRHTTSTGT